MAPADGLQPPLIRSVSPMKQGYSAQLTRQIGEHLVVANLGRLGIPHCAIWPKELMKYRDNRELITRHFNAIK
jgi:hypothetical protein